MILIVDKDIICSRCGKPSRIKAENGKLCLLCWRLTRQENRDSRLKNSLDICFSYMNDKKVTEKEAKIISEVMEELNKDKPLKKRLCKKKDLEMIFGKSKKKSSKLKKKKKLHL